MKRAQSLGASLIESLHLNAQTKFDALFSKTDCAERSTSGMALLLRNFSDEPDLGMDENLPDVADPDGDRPWMGGRSGVTSKGFRHMRFGGWDPLHPITTFQIPVRGVGQALERTQIIATRARELLKQDDVTAWAWGHRTLAWSLHYVQDLAQPFHAIQLPHLELVPWSTLWESPLKGAFPSLVRETTRTIANYHWAYEHWVARFLASSPNHPNCLSADAFTLQRTPAQDADVPGLIADAVRLESQTLAPDLGRALLAYFGESLKAPGVDLPRNVRTPDYKKLEQDPARAGARQALREVSCKALSNALTGSRLLMTWAL